MQNERTLETAVGAITATMYANGECYVSEADRDAGVTVNRIAYRLYGRVHVARGGVVSRSHLDEHGYQQLDTFELTRVDWMSCGSWGAAKGSYATTDKALRAVCAAVSQECQDDPAWLTAGEYAALDSKRERLERERDEAQAKANVAITALVDVQNKLDALRATYYSGGA